MPEKTAIEGSNHPIPDYAGFWPYYLQEHARPGCRAMHYIGTLGASACVAALVVTGNWWFLLAGLLSGYGMAWVAHFFIEKNRPATFAYPLWSLVSDYRMTWFWLTGRIRRELDRAGVV